MTERIALPASPRILVVTLRRIGDALLTTPLIRSVKRAWPQAAIDVLTYEGVAGILRGNPDIDSVITMPARPGAGQTFTLATSLWKKYDLAISTQSGDRPTYFAVIAGRHSAAIVEDGKFGGAIKRRLLSRATPHVEDIHRVEQMLRLADALGVARTPEVVTPVPAGETARQGRYAVVHAAPMYRYKEWTPDGWRALADGLQQRGIEIVAIGGPGEAERAFLEKVWQGRVAIHQLDWPENVALLSRAALYVGPDTSVTHLAAASGCPTVALFGPTDPRLWGPWPNTGLNEPWFARGEIQNRGNVWLVQNSPPALPCVPCQYEGCERHTASFSQCLDEMPADRVLAAVDAALASRA
ncbi:MAG: glycosyltransferase family 9 protein [Pseudolabrys sp.]|nr:glycosyltransferase family 9 protein [Pseudolabrys sp.]